MNGKYPDPEEIEEALIEMEKLGKVRRNKDNPYKWELIEKESLEEMDHERSNKSGEDYRREKKS